MDHFQIPGNRALFLLLEIKGDRVCDTWHQKISGVLPPPPHIIRAGREARVQRSLPTSTPLNASGRTEGDGASVRDIESSSDGSEEDDENEDADDADSGGIESESPLTLVP